MTSLKTSIKTITYLSDIGCLEIQGASLRTKFNHIVHIHERRTIYFALPLNYRTLQVTIHIKPHS